jgi:hypothetical protein
VINCVKVHQVGSSVLKWCPSDVASCQVMRCFADATTSSIAFILSSTVVANSSMLLTHMVMATKSLSTQ